MVVVHALSKDKTVQSVIDLLTDVCRRQNTSVS